MKSPEGSTYNKVVMQSSHGAKMGGVPGAVSTKLTPRRSAAINEGVPMPSTGSSNPMSAIKGKSNGKNGGAIC
jgi:hypothetical protein